MFLQQTLATNLVRDTSKPILKDIWVTFPMLVRSVSLDILVGHSENTLVLQTCKTLVREALAGAGRLRAQSWPMATSTLDSSPRAQL